MVPADEPRLLQRAKQGDDTAFGELVHRYQTTMYNIALRLLGRHQEAEDAVQESFLRAYGALGRFDTDLPFSPWIKRITVNLCLNWLESARVKPHLLASDLGNTEDVPADMGRWANPEPGPEQVAMAREQSHRIRQAILQLPPRYRAVIELRHYQEMRYDEMAAALQRPLSSVKSDLFRARKMLAQILKRYG